MFRPVQMVKVRILIFEKYLDPVINKLGKLEILHSLDIKREKLGLNKVLIDRSLTRISDILNRVDKVIDILKISDSKSEKRIVTEMRIDELDKNLSEIENLVLEKNKEVSEVKKEIEELVAEKNKLELVNTLGVKREFLRDSMFLSVTVGVIPAEELERLKAIKTEHILIHNTINGKAVVCIANLRKDSDKINMELSSFKLEKISVPELPPDDEIQKKLKEDKRRIKELEKELETIREKNASKLLEIREIAKIEKKKMGLELLMGKTNKVFLIEGWIPEKRINILTEEIDTVTNGSSVIKVYKPKDENVPIILENPGIFKPFESLTMLFGYPSYNEIDPTIILAITFPLIFGLMFGDVGHGAVIALGGIAILKLMRNDFGKILLYCGISAIVFGFLYGSIFGDEHILPTIWVKPSHNMIEMIGVALFVGILHMGIGVIINGINRIQKDKSLALISISKLWFLFGEGILIAKLFGFPIPLFFELSRLNYLTIAVYGIGIPAMAFLLIEVFNELHKSSVKELIGVIGMSLFEILETFTGFLSNTISYSRILILAVVHAMMCMAIFSIAEIFGFPLNITILIFGTILVIVLEGLIAFIHTIRLHYYEWFTKFYSGEGTMYEPFSLKNGD